MGYGKDVLMWVLKTNKLNKERQKNNNRSHPADMKRCNCQLNGVPLLSTAVPTFASVHTESKLLVLLSNIRLNICKTNILTFRLYIRDDNRLINNELLFNTVKLSYKVFIWTGKKLLLSDPYICGFHCILGSRTVESDELHKSAQSRVHS